MEQITRMHSIYGKRHYYTMTPGGLVLLPSVTTILRATMPTPEYLTKWRASLGEQQATDYTRHRAHYGTLLHILIASFLDRGKICLSEVGERATAYIEANHVHGDIYNWTDDLQSDLLAFAQFCHDRTLQPLHTELTMHSPALGYAGTADIICTIQCRGKKVKAIVDIKSGRGKDSDEHGLQLAAYKDLYNVGGDATHCFKWSPKAWTAKPTYDFVDYSDKKYGEWFGLLLKIYKAQQDTKTKAPTIRQYNGTIELREPVTSQYCDVDIIDHLTSKYCAEVKP